MKDKSRDHEPGTGKSEPKSFFTYETPSEIVLSSKEADHHIGQSTVKYFFQTDNKNTFANSEIVDVNVGSIKQFFEINTPTDSAIATRLSKIDESQIELAIKLHQQISTPQLKDLFSSYHSAWNDVERLGRELIQQAEKNTVIQDPHG